MQPQPFMIQLQSAQPAPQMPRTAKDQGGTFRGVSDNDDTIARHPRFVDDLRAAGKHSADISSSPDGESSRTIDDATAAHAAGPARPADLSESQDAGDEGAIKDSEGDNAAEPVPAMTLVVNEPLRRVEAAPIYVDPEQKLFSGDAAPRRTIESRSTFNGGHPLMDSASAPPVIGSDHQGQQGLTGRATEQISPDDIQQTGQGKTATGTQPNESGLTQVRNQAEASRQAGMPADLRSSMTLNDAGTEGPIIDGKSAARSVEVNGNTAEKPLQPSLQPVAPLGDRIVVEHVEKTESAAVRISQATLPGAEPTGSGETGHDPPAKTAEAVLGIVDREMGTGSQGPNDHTSDFRQPAPKADATINLRGGDEPSLPDRGSDSAKNDRSGVMQQVVKKAIFSVQNGQSEVRLQLKPEFLGEMRMQITTENQQVSIRISAELSAVKDILETHLHQLKAELNNQGMTVEELEVSVADDSGQQRGRLSDPTDRAKRNARRAGTAVDAAGGSEAEEPLRNAGAGNDARAVDYFA